MEFNQYLEWAFNKIPSIQKNTEVTSIAFDGKSLFIETPAQRVSTKKLVLGTGLIPYVPKCCDGMIGSDIYHNAYFLDNLDDFSGKRLVVIGGGQSGAEIVCNLLANEKQLPLSIHWVSKRLNFLTIDDSPFTNELFTPKYAKHFYQLDPQKKQSLLSDQKLASDGISQSTAEEIYRKLYEFRFIKNKSEALSLLPYHDLCHIEKTSHAYKVNIIDSEKGNNKVLLADKIILCTGYHYQEPYFLSGIQDMLHYDKYGLVINDHYEMSWDGMDICTIYMQNGAKHTHGVADPNLSLLAYRSAMILHHALGEVIYPKINSSCLVDWAVEI